MITFQQFLSFLSEKNVDLVKKFEKDFYTMYRPGALSVTTIGFLIDFSDEESWDAIDELVKVFKPLHVWIGTAENREAFGAKYQNITVEPYSFFEEGGFFPLAVIPISVMTLIKSSDED